MPMDNKVDIDTEVYDMRYQSLAWKHQVPWYNTFYKEVLAFLSD